MPRPHFLTPIPALLALQLAACAPGWSPAVLPVAADSTVHVVSGKVRVILVAGDTLSGEGLLMRRDSTWLQKMYGEREFIPRDGILAVERKRRGIPAGVIVGAGLIVAFFYMIGQSLEISPGGTSLVVGC